MYISKGLIFKMFAALIVLALAQYQSFALITVTNTNNSGSGSLRNALSSASSGETIDFNLPGSGPWTISLSSTLDIDDVIIQGPTGNTLTLDGQGTVRVCITQNTVSISDITIDNGSVSGDGAGIKNSGDLTLTDVIIEDCDAISGDGGGIYSVTGDLTLTRVTVQRCSSSSEGGGVYYEGIPGFEGSGTSLLIEYSTIDDNDASEAGGGIFLQVGTQQEIGGPISATIRYSTISNNTDDNSQESGGGIYIQEGGYFCEEEIYVVSYFSLDMTNCTVSGNQSDGDGGGIYMGFPSLLNMINCTITDNTSNQSGGGIYVDAATACQTTYYATLNMKTSIVAANTASSTGPDIEGQINSNGYNYLGSTSGNSGITDGSNNDHAGHGDPNLGALQDNGGQTETHAITSSSSSFLPGGGTSSGTPDDDQRGYTRTTVYDIGAYEYNAIEPEIDDGDGIAGSVEDQSPNNGDGNNDGTADKFQGNVTSFESGSGHGYITLEVSNTSLTFTEVTTSNTLTDPEGHVFPFGQIGFKLNTNGPVTVRIYFHNATSLEGLVYRKYGKTPPYTGSDGWFTFNNVTYGTETIGGKTVAYADLTLENDKIGDVTDEDGVIIDPGGPGSPGGIPTMTEWAAIIMGGLLAVLGAWFIIRRRLV